jgi:CSLREA domain-containing protein
MAWKVDAANGHEGNLAYLADNTYEFLDQDVYGTFGAVHLSDGHLIWNGTISPENDIEVSLYEGSPPQQLDLAPPPIRVEAELGPTSLTLRWNTVLGVDGYTVYLAQSPGVTPANYDSLPGGARLDGVVSPLVIGGVDPSTNYYAVVTTTEAGTEGPPSGEAATFGFLIDTTDDTPDANPSDGICADAQGNCSLRAAVSEANRESPSPAVIAVPPGTYTLTRAGNDETNFVGDLDLLNAMTIVGAGIEETVIQGLGAATFQSVLDINSVGGDAGFLVRLEDLTVTGGNPGLWNRGELRLDRVRVRDNGADTSTSVGPAITHDGPTLELADCELDHNATSSHGGAMMVFGTRADIKRSSIHDNKAGLGGGAFYMFSRDVRVTDSTLRDNTARHSQNWPGGAILMEGGELLLRASAVYGNDTPDCGGAIFQLNGDLTLVNTTVSGNHADAAGGAICSRGGDRLDLIHSTVAFNTATLGPTLDLGTGASLLLHSTILRNDVGMDDCRFDGSLAIGALGFNIGNCVDNGETNNVDPLLDALADNGGPTATHALLEGSPALDAVPDGECVTRLGEGVGKDQRGRARPVDHDFDGEALCDPGAYEAGPACIDDDGDGFPAHSHAECLAGAPADCDDGAGGSWSLPGENRDLRFDDGETLRWSAPVDPGGLPEALVHEVLRSPDPSNLSAGAACGLLAPGVTESVETAMPGPGQLLAYLTRATNACAGESSWGEGPSGQAREVVCSGP